MAAPDITVGAIAVAIGVATAEDDTLDAGVDAVVTRLLAVAASMVTADAPAAPVDVANEAVVRLVGWLYDSDPASNRREADPMVGSGAAGLLARWRPQRTLRGAGAPATPSVTPSTGTGGPGVDSVARAAAAAAQADVDALEGVVETEQLTRASADTALGGRVSTAEAAVVAVKTVADAALPAADARVGRIPSAGGTKDQVWKKGPANEAAAWRDDETASAGAGGNDATARAAAAAAKQQAGDAQHLAEENHESIAALEDGGYLTTGYGAWALWSVSDYHAGFHLATGLTNNFNASDFGPGSNVFSGVATNRRIVMSVPSGVDPARVRVRLTLNGAESFKPGSGEEWRKFTPANADRSRDYYYLAVSASGNHVVQTFAANDRVDLQIRPVVPVATSLRPLQNVVRATQDVIVGDVVDHAWQTVDADHSEGGVTSAVQTWNLAKAKAASYAPSVNGAANASQIARIPASADPRSYRLVIAGLGPELLNHFLRLGHDDDWQYYEQSVGLPDPAAVTLQISNRVLAHTTWAGALADGIVTKASLAADVGTSGGGGGGLTSRTHNQTTEVKTTFVDTGVAVPATGDGILLFYGQFKSQASSNPSRSAGYNTIPLLVPIPASVARAASVVQAGGAGGTFYLPFRYVLADVHMVQLYIGRIGSNLAVRCQVGTIQRWGVAS